MDVLCDEQTCEVSGGMGWLLGLLAAIFVGMDSVHDSVTGAVNGFMDGYRQQAFDREPSAGDIAK